MENEIVARTSNNENMVVIIAIGTNDSVFKLDSNDTETTPDKFKNDLAAVVDIAKKYTKEVILVGLLPCEEDKMQPMPWSRSGKSYSNQRLGMFNDCISDVAASQDIIFIDMFKEMMMRDVGVYLHDGLHPNAAGHQYIADKLKKIVGTMANDY
jgi:lysophospholipase L1-like esterase